MVQFILSHPSSKSITHLILIIISKFPVSLDVDNFLATIRNLCSVPSIYPISLSSLSTLHKFSKQVSTEKLGNSHSIIFAKYTNAPVS